MIKKYFTACLTFLLTLILHQDSNSQLNRDVVLIFMAEGDSAGSKLGYQVAGLGDQNGDGFDDILVSAPGDRKAFIYFGGNPMDKIPDIIFHKENEEMFGVRLCNLEDVNGDSFADIAIGSIDLTRIYWGGTELDSSADLILPPGRICAAGDVNGDDYDDILFSSVDWQSYRGRATIYFGGENPDSTADWSTVGDSAWCYFGTNICGNGDINGDGFDDIAISGYRWLKRIAYPYPYIRIFYGSTEMDSIPYLIMDSFDQPLDISTRAAFIDVNGNSLSDLCVDSHGDTSALLFYGPILPEVMPDIVLHGTYLSGAVWEISDAGDVNNDGYSDIITGNYDGVGGLGEVLVFLGGPYMDGKWDVLINGFIGPYECAGRSVGKAGDVNGDGVDDILFGAWCERDFNLQGRVVIFSGDTTLTSVLSDAPLANKPHSVYLKQNYPNPFNELTVIEYDIAVVHPTRSVIKIYNILGQEIVTLVDELQDSGCYQALWNGRDKLGKDVGSGIYFYRLQVDQYQWTKKLLLIR